jgi:surface antigen
VKLIVSYISSLTTMVLMVALTGCATNQDAQHDGHHAEAATSKASGPMVGGPSGDQMSMMDMKAMCDMHQKMMRSKTPEEQRAMINEHMKTMSPEMRQQHMAMMEKCT